MLSTRMDFQDAMARGLGVTEYARQSRAAHEVEALWIWTRTQLEGTPRLDDLLCRQAAA
jgi:chromosome partitioning protein